MSKEEKIMYEIEEINDPNIDVNTFNVSDFVYDMNDININYDINCSHIINYHENYTVKELLLICEYYGFVKEIKTNKLNKNEIIEYLVNFEANPLNEIICLKRQTMWFYVNELKNDKFMKKYVLW